MPKPRKADSANTTNTSQDTPNSRKRKRDNQVLVEAGAPRQLKPRKEKRTNSANERTSAVEVASKLPRMTDRVRNTEVEKEVAIEVTAEADGSLSAQGKTKFKIEGSKEPSKKIPRKTAKPRAAKVVESDSEQDYSEEGLEEEVVVETVKPIRKRKTKEEKEAEAMPLAARTVGLKMFVGAHTSIAKGVENAITNCVHIGGNAFACFLKSQRKWDNPALKDENKDAFRKALLEHKYDAAAHIVPHGSYLVNLATEDKDKAKQSYDAFIDDLHRCEALGIRYYNFHPGGAGQSPFDEAVTRLAQKLNRALSETKTVVPLLENMAGHGTLIGGRFSDLRDVISQIKPEYKSRVGVCIDTCHAFAAGYDLRTPEAFRRTMKEFDEVVGLKYLKALHLNDSKAPFNSHRDLHQNIGLGFLGLRAFHNVMNEPHFQGLPLVLETPCEKPDPKDPKGKKTIEDKSIWAREIKLLENLIGMDPEGEEFKRLEKELSEKGKKERDEMQAQFEKKLEKERKKLAKVKGKGQQTLNFFGKGSADSTGKKNQRKEKKKGSESEEESELSELSEADDEV